jgi:hypothetical protein
MGKIILNRFQKKVLEEFAKTPLVKKFYLGGGTALAQFYLQHRQSEDLDFFTQQELDLEELKRFISSISKKTNISQVEFQHGFGLYTFFLSEGGGKFKHKIDFGQYPFEPIENLKKVKGIFVESIYDIAINKTHTIAFHPRLRDFVDLYFILKNNRQWNFQDLLKESFIKFEMKTDALQVGENLLKVLSLKDMPLMLKKVDLKKMQIFFLNEAKKLKNEVWK